MEEKYNNYLDAFSKLDIADKRQEIIDELLNIIKVFYKVNTDFNLNVKLLPVKSDYKSEDEYLNSLISYVISLRELSSGAVNLIGDNLYE